MPRCLALLAVLALTSPAGLAQAEDLVAFHGRLARAQTLAHQAADAWTAASADRSENVRRALLGFAGAAELAARQLGDHRTDEATARRLESDLEQLARDVQSAFDRERTSSATREAWAETRRALVALTDPASVRPAAPSSPVPSRPAEEPTSRLETPPADPDAPQAIISDTRWSGTFTPDLVVSGRVEGRGLRSGALIVRDSSGREVYRADKEINEAIAAATQGSPADSLATAVFSVRIDDDDLKTGENLIVITVTDSRGRTAEASVSKTKRLF